MLGLPEDLASVDADQQARWLMAQVLEYHRREDKPAWWAYFARLMMSPDELVEDPEAIGGLTVDDQHPPLPYKSSYEYTLRFPEQEHKLKAGDEILDQANERGVTVVQIDDASGLLVMRRGKNRHDEALPHALVPGGPYRTPEQRAALRRLAGEIIDVGLEGPGRFRAARDLLRADPPRITGVPAGSALQNGGAPPIDDLYDIVDGLDESCLFIQGPPGSGKTWTGGQLIARLLKAGKRVGVTANSHKAIHNLLHEVEAAADEHGMSFRGRKKSSNGNDESRYVSRFGDRFISNAADGGSFPPAREDRVLLTAGTAWLYAPEAMDDAVDYLFIDEAGQRSLADALAVATSARNIVLLGDPLQLAQVSKAVHPGSAGCSVLEHLLGEHGTIPPQRGIFLDNTRRMHPDVCRFVSEVIYENRLGSIPEVAQQRVDAPGALTGTGVRFLSVAHDGQHVLVCRRGRRHRRGDRGSPHRHVDQRQGPDRHDRPRTDHGRHPVQRAGATAARPAADRRPRGHGRQVPGPGGRSRLLLDGHVIGRRRAAQLRVPLQPQPPQRRGLPGTLSGHPRVQPGTPAHQLPVSRADAPRQRALPTGRTRREWPSRARDRLVINSGRGVPHSPA